MNMEKVKQGPPCMLLGHRRGRWHHVTWAEGLNLSRGPSRWSFRWVGRKPQWAGIQAGRVFLIGWWWVVNLPAPPPPHDRVESPAPQLWGWGRYCDCLGQQNVVSSGSVPGETGWDPGLFT